MDERKQFTFYESFYNAMRRIRKKQDRADAYDLICEYALFQKEPDLDGVPDAVAIAFELLRPVLDSARKKAVSGKQGGSKPKQTGSKPKQTGREKEGEKEKEVEIERDIEKEHTQSGSLFDTFWSNYPPNHRGAMDAARDAWGELEDLAKQSALDALTRWKRSQRWVSDAGAFIPIAANFLNPERGYLTADPAPAAGSVWGSGEKSDLDQEIIRRMLQEV